MDMMIAATGITILVISVTGAALWARRSGPDQPRILFFFLYFWVLALLLLIVAAIGYALLN